MSKPNEDGYKIPSPGLQKALRGRQHPYEIEVAEVADNTVMLYVVIDVRPEKIEVSCWQVALAVDSLARYLGDYPNMTTAWWQLDFDAARTMLNARKLKDR